MFRWSAEATDNPYLALLGLADRFVVTGDSVSMLVEVARVGKPLAIFPLPVAGGIVPAMKKRLASVFQPEPGGGGGRLLTRFGDLLYDAGLVGYSREFEAVHRALIDGGFAVLLGRPFPTAPARVPMICHRSPRAFARSSPSGEGALPLEAPSAKSIVVQMQQTVELFP